MTYRKKLIEVALPLEAINRASAREKSIRHGHPNALHQWWARRPLAATRTVLFTSLVDDPDSPDAPPQFVQACRGLPRGKNAAANDTPRQRLFDFVELLSAWESTTDRGIVETARMLINLSTEQNPPAFLDPFAGGGSIPLEAQRLGLRTNASDLNPVSVAINKVLLEIMPRFSNTPCVNPRDRSSIARDVSWAGIAGMAADVQYYGSWMQEEAWNRIGHLYPLGPNNETVVAWLWARTVRSPNPAVNAHVPLIRNFWLSRKKGKTTWIEPQVDRINHKITFDIRTGSGQAPKSVIGRTGGKCLISGAPIPLEYIKREGQSGRMGVQLIAIAADGPNGRTYYPPCEEHELAASQAQPSWLPDFEMSTHSQYMAPPRFGMTTFAHLFTPRQLVGLSTFSDLIPEVQNQVYQDALSAGMPVAQTPLRDSGQGALAYAQAVSVLLAFVLDKLADLGNSLCPWEPVAECPRNLFGRQLMSMTWNFAEGNVMSNRSGSWNALLRNFRRNLNSFGKTDLALEPGSVSQGDVLLLTYAKEYLVSTDPPYYDNVPYADLSDFFYVWLRRSLRDIYPDVFSTVLVPKDAELVADHERWGGRERATAFFEEGLERAFSAMRHAIAPAYPLTVFYAFKQSEDLSVDGSTSRMGWETMLESLIAAGFCIVGTWPMRTELTKALKTSMNFLASSILLVCRVRPQGAAMSSRREFVNALGQELPSALRDIQSGNIAPVDLAQASIGPGMAVYSRYSKVLEPNGDRLTVRAALQIINHELDAYLTEQEGYIDADSRFAIAWFEQFGFKEAPFGQADVLARAKNTSVDGLADAGVLESGAGKVRLYRWSELDPGWDPSTGERPSVWEAVHHLIERLNVYGEEGAARLLAKMPSDLAAQARQLAYRLYSICARKGWAEHARDYNALVISWGASQEQARQFKEQHQQIDMFSS